ncbi:MAG TPA: hypothetical protein ENH67_18840 [Pseudoalteromonas sp.]|uniref:Uncharacterized protein n=1 Tax=marine sediment metagenome TaxID=412755 RepID=A0A0F9D3X0_9ZZZZ|nr:MULTISPECIES: hypothetical protein [unclassified Pseudoalteromonas]MBH0018679.1 hypothetical protein [Pseudoalteromonas sp. NGC95]HDY92412.1 hypothetical protein [Pseudoalteromonas sp.]HDZ34888.1 hypothetical protein [Pseudoalteromonas sp.]
MKSLLGKAKHHRDKAEEELQSKVDSRLDYAALSLRKSIEYLAYDRLNAYKNEINLNIYDVWQPGKVITHLCEIDPRATEERTMSVAITNKDLPIEDQDYKVLGIEIPITINLLKKPYNSLGSYLHAPIIKKINDGQVEYPDKLRTLCEDLLKDVDRVLSSTIWSTAVGEFFSFDCFRCKKSAIFRNIEGADTRKVWCSHCNARYTARLDEKSEIKLTPHVGKLACITPDCNSVHELWEDTFEYEKQFKCKECHGLFRYIYAVQPLIESKKA